MVRSEPCDRCGDETAIGSPLFPGRHQGRQDDGAEVFRCHECAARELPAHEHDQPSEDAGQDWLTKSMSGVAIYKQW